MTNAQTRKLNQKISRDFVDFHEEKIIPVDFQECQTPCASPRKISIDIAHCTVSLR